MKTTYETKTRANAIQAGACIMNMINGIKDAVNNKPECTCRGMCTCSSRYWTGGINADGTKGFVSPSYYGETTSFSIENGLMQVQHKTCSGTVFTWELLKTCTGVWKATVTHDGRRNSYPGGVPWRITENYRKVFNYKNFSVITYETSEPDWFPLNNCLCDRPKGTVATQEEYVHALAEQIYISLVEIYKTISLPCPYELAWDEIYNKNTGEVSVNFTEVSSVFYRRLYACRLQSSLSEVVSKLHKLSKIKGM